MPPPVMGATLFFTSAFVFTSGLQMITARLLDSRKIIVIGFSFALAMIADIYHDVLAHAPIMFQPILDNALVLGTVCAVVLNLIMRIGVRKRVSIRFPPGGINREAVEQFLSEQGAHWAARGDILQRAVFGVIQSLDVLGQTAWRHRNRREFRRVQSGRPHPIRRSASGHTRAETEPARNRRQRGG